MKKILKFSAAVILSAFLLQACKKQISEYQYLGGTPPIFTSSSTAPLVLDPANASNTVITFSWTNPNYQFSTGISSQDVNYTIQFDTTGANFTSPLRQEMGVSKDTVVSLTVAQLNSYIVKQGLKAYQSHNIDIRLKSSLANGSVALYSNVIKIVITPYLAYSILPPGTPSLGFSDGTLFLVGDATDGGWNNPVPVPAQQFTQIDVLHYTLTAHLTGGKQYLFIPLNGNWGYKYGASCGSDGCNSRFGDSFIPGGSNFAGPSTTGTYTIKVDFVLGTFSVQ